ncbi:hypothetical protein KKB83_01935 [Patescibacteria group bacterium]|nr:hypothetical protein [Patescibacteria group bacterium]
MLSTFVLIDGNSLLHRAYHALPSLTTPSGQPTGAVYGFTSMLIKALDELAPEYLAVAFDTKEPTFRHARYAEYKAHRPKMDEELVLQVDLVKEVVDTFGFPRFEVPGYEADDIVATIIDKLKVKSVPRDEVLRGEKFQPKAGPPLAEKVKSLAEVEIVIVTGDLDLLQLVSDNVRVYTSKKGLSDTIIYDTKAVEKRYGLPPEKLRDYKALVGDSSDNIPGVKGVGPKGATQLLMGYYSLEGIYEHLGDMPDGQGAMLSSQREQAFLSRDLVQMAANVPIDFDTEFCRIRDADWDRVGKLFKRLRFESLLKRLPRGKENEQGSLFS